MLTSSELARIAGTTTRALRHYHKLGILPEPDRDSNGYRQYTVQHLVQTLRIKQLQSLGFSLGELTPILEDSINSLDLNSHLDEVEETLRRQILAAEARLHVIASIRAHNLDPTLPIEGALLLRKLSVHEETDLDSTLNRDIVSTVLAMHSGDGLSAVTAILTASNDGSNNVRSKELSARMRQLEMNSSPEEYKQLLADLRELVKIIIPPGFNFQSGDLASWDATLLALMEGLLFGPEGMNPAQRRIINELFESLKNNLNVHV